MAALLLAAAAPAAAQPEPPPSVSSAPAKQELPTLGPARRDPLLPPLHEPAGWHELLLAVVLNGQTVSAGGLFVERSDGRLAAQLALLEAWRIRTEVADVLTFQGAPYYPLDAISGATFRLDRDALTLLMEVPPEEFSD